MDVPEIGNGTANGTRKYSKFVLCQWRLYLTCVELTIE